MNIAIVGATGNVGRKLIEVLEKKNFPISELFLVASSKSEGKKLIILERNIQLLLLKNLTSQKLRLLFLQQEV